MVLGTSSVDPPWQAGVGRYWSATALSGRGRPRSHAKNRVDIRYLGRPLSPSNVPLFPG